MISFSRLMRPVGHHILQDKMISLGSFLVLLIALILIDFFWVASINVNQQYEEALKTVRMEIYLSDSVPEALLPAMKQGLLSYKEVDSVGFVSKEEAGRLLEADLGAGILEDLGENPLPRSLVVHFGRGINLATLDEIQNHAAKMSGVTAIEYGRPWIEKVENIGRGFRRIGYLVGSLILFVVLLTMANTNRLTARSKSHDFFQLQLLGAGPMYLVYPFLADGFLSGFVAALLGWMLLFYIAGQMMSSGFTPVFPSLGQILIYSVLAGLAGVFGAYLGIRKLLVS